jgi:hypothetical protein
VLAIIGTMMNSRPSVLQAAGGPTVTIDPTQLPLPVQGSLGVSGTVAATQSGNWNVAITGTPNVKVTNPLTAPALTLDISKSASQHVELLCASFNTVVCTAGGSLTPPYTVPAGQNLVVTSIDILTAGGGGASQFFIHRGIAMIGSAWAVPNDGSTHSFQYPSGIVYAAGYTFVANNVALVNTFEAKLEGYLTPI